MTRACERSGAAKFPAHRSVPAPTTCCSRYAHAPLDFLTPLIAPLRSFDFLTRSAPQQGRI